MIGIYCIINKINGKRYIGSTHDLEKRKKTHFKYLVMGKHSVVNLQDDYNKWGREAFKFEILEILDDENDLIFQENYWIASFNSITTGYNLIYAKSSSSVDVRLQISTSTKGRQHCEESKKKISDAKIGIPRSIETKEAISKAKKGISLSEKHKKKISNSNKGRVFDQKDCQKISEGVKRTLKRYKENWEELLRGQHV